jgi:hypothetical protein
MFPFATFTMAPSQGLSLVNFLRCNLQGTRDKKKKGNNISMATFTEFNKMTCPRQIRRQEYLLEERSASISLV